MQEIKKSSKRKSRDIKKEKFSFRNYLKSFLIFIRDNMEKTFGILLIISLLLIAIELKLFLSVTGEVVETQKVGLFKSFLDDAQIIIITAFAGIVPYMYAPVVGYFGYLYTDSAKFALNIQTLGYLKGISLGIVPLILNTIVICIVTSLGIYICKKITVGYKISNVKNMNFLNFRIRVYEVMGKEDKVKEYTKKRDDKIAKLESKKEKLNFLQIANTLALCLIIQFISTVIERVLL